VAHNLILGTAGHIDHGKTALVKALTGIDCDRLPEEKARGITIDIGFATLELGDFHLGIVDVPGHERFIKNMLAGATGIDLALLVVAADDSVMPQTREHLEILGILGIHHGVIALTKCDLVDETTRGVVELEVRELVRGTFLQSAPLVHTSVHNGTGLDVLTAALTEACRAASTDRQARGESHSAEWFRMAIDRAFVVQGHGTVVTGSVTSGSVRVGDEVEWQPRGQSVRVRSLQNHGQSVSAVGRGMRAAINLAGVRHEEVSRGQELAQPGFLRPSRCLTVRLRALPEIGAPIKHRAPVRVHLGTGEVMAVVALLDRDRLQPGTWGPAQLFFSVPVTAVWGQPFVIRSPSASHTLGGGQVLQPVTTRIRRRHPELLDRLERLWDSDPATRAAELAWFAGPAGVTGADLVRGAGVNPARVKALLDSLCADGRLVSLAVAQARHHVLHADRLRELEARIDAAVRHLEEENPLAPRQDRQRVEGQLGYVGDEALVHAVVDRLLEQGRLRGDLRHLARAGYEPRLTSGQRELKNTILGAYRDARFQLPALADFERQAGGNLAVVRTLLDNAVAEGQLIHLAEALYLHAHWEPELRRLAREILRDGQGHTVAEFRTHLQTTRRSAVPLCSYLDRIGLTRRDGDLRYDAESSPQRASS